MTNYPEKTCEIDRLVRHPKLVAAAIAGQKTQQRRNGVYGWPGETFELDGVPLEITALERKTLAEMTDEDARAEGYPDLKAYQDLILKMHPGMNWDGDAKVWVHYFKKK